MPFRTINAPVDPADQAVLAATMDSALATAQGGAGTAEPNYDMGVLTSGTIFLYKIWVPATLSAASMLYYVVTAGATLTASSNKVGLYGSDGNLIGQMADQTTNFGSVGLKSGALASGPFTITGGKGVFVWAAVLAVGTTPPKLAGVRSTIPMNPGKGSPYAATPAAGAIHRVGYTSVGSRTSLVSLNTATITDNLWGFLHWLAIA